MHLLCILSSTNSPSNSSFLAEQFTDVFMEKGATVTVLNLNDLHIDHFTLRHYERDYDHEADYRMVQEALASCDGLLIATPVWNFGVPACLKNLIDRLGAFGLDAENRTKGQLKGLPFFVIFTGGAPDAGWNILMRRTTSFIREGLRYFDATPSGAHYEQRCMASRGKFAFVADQRPKSIAIIRRKAARFHRIVDRYVRTGQAPRLPRLWGAAMKWGERMLKRLG